MNQLQSSAQLATVTDATSASMALSMSLAVLMSNVEMWPTLPGLLTYLKKACHLSLAVLLINLLGFLMRSLSSDPTKHN
jgi:hypothetical protein